MTRALVVAALALAACNPILTAESPAPPGRSARLDPVDGFWGTKSYRLELSQGAAIAVSCGGSCEHLVATSADPAIAEVRLASLSALRTTLTGARTVAELVIIGHAAGATHVHVHAAEGDRDVAVTIVSPPSSH